MLTRGFKKSGILCFTAHYSSSLLKKSQISHSFLVGTQACSDESILKPVDVNILETIVDELCKLIGKQKFVYAKHLLTSISTQASVHPVPSIASALKKICKTEWISSKFLHMLFSIYSDAGMFEKAFETFNIAVGLFGKFNGRLCHQFLLVLKKSNQTDLAVLFFQRMLEEYGVDVSTHSMAMVVDGLCKGGSVQSAQDLIDEMHLKEVKPNIYCYNSLIRAYGKKRDFESIGEIL